MLNILYYLTFAMLSILFVLIYIHACWLALDHKTNGEKVRENHINRQLSRKYDGVDARSSAYGHSKYAGK